MRISFVTNFYIFKKKIAFQSENLILRHPNLLGRNQMNIFISGSSISDDFNKTDQSKDLILRIPVFVEIKIIGFSTSGSSNSGS